MSAHSILHFTNKIVVLKFGSSILQDAKAYQSVTDEIKRFCDKKYKVLAVVSAIGQTTDHLTQKHASLSLGKGIKDKDEARLLSTGEIQSAIYLNATLIGHGFKTECLCEAIYAKGTLLNAEPTGFAQNQLEQLFHHNDVVVVPGFIATNDQGETCLLGRGGSDLSALYLAHKLNALHCILYKDVNGVYECDPNLNKHAKCYQALTYQDALKCAGSVIQERALLWAKKEHLPFRVGALGTNNYTVIGAVATYFDNFVQNKLYSEVA